MPGSRHETVQENLFGNHSVPERFRIDPEEKAILRTVTPRAPEKAAITTVMGSWDSSLATHDLRAAADLAYLRRKEPPALIIDNPVGHVRVADLFSGCGAMSLGVFEACRALSLQFVPVGAFDTDARALQVYERNFGGKGFLGDLSEVLESDLELSPTRLELELMETLGKVDFVVGGPPCQGHSNLNNRTRRNDPKNQLYFLMARFAQLFSPEWVIVENVLTVLHDKSGVFFRTQEALENLGYETTDGVLDLFRLGVPQTRRRHVLVGRRKAGVSKGISLGLPDLEHLISGHYTRPRSLAWAVEDLLNITGAEFVDQTKTPDPVTQSRIDYLFDHNLFDLPDSQRPHCHRSKKHSYSSVYGRMRWEDPAPTITGGFDTMGRGRFVHPKRRRTITAHEAARVQMIPDFFRLALEKATRKSVGEMIGNAVPPKMSYALAVELLR